MTKTYRYRVPNEDHQGWAILFLDESGCFAALSDYGHYSYRWNTGGFASHETIRKFMLTCDNGYLLSKLVPRETLDVDQTLKELRTHILQQRRNSTFDRERARDEWDLAKDIEGEAGFTVWVGQTVIPEAYEFACYDYPPDAQAFMTKVWPRLKKLIADELAQEKP